MSKIFTFGFWNSVARLILRNRIIIILLILATTVFFASQWKNMRFSFTEANLLPDDHEVNQEYNAFLEKFGEEGNLIVMGIKDSSLFTEKNYQAWKALNDSLQKFPEVDYAISIGNLKKLEKFEDPKRFQMVPFITEPLNSFIEDNIDDVENIVEMLYNNEEDKDDAFDEKVASLQNLSVEEVVQLFSPKELLTIYANLYQEEEVISLAGYNEDGEKEIVVLSNESDD